MAEPGVRAPQLLGDPVVQLGEALDVQLVDGGVAPPGTDLAVVAPVELVVHHHAPSDVRRRVALVPDVRALVVASRSSPASKPKIAGIGDELATDCAGVGVEQQLVRVEAQALLRVPRPVGAEAVALARRYAGQGAVPDAEAVLGQRRAGSRARRRPSSSNRHTHTAVGVGCVHREVGRLLAPGGAEGPVAPGPDRDALVGGRPLTWSHPAMMSFPQDLVRDRPSTQR